MSGAGGTPLDTRASARDPPSGVAPTVTSARPQASGASLCELDPHTSTPDWSAISTGNGFCTAPTTGVTVTAGRRWSALVS